MKRFVLVFAPIVIMGCSVPDDGNYGAVVSDITSLSADERMDIARAMAAERFWNWYLENTGSYQIHANGDMEPDDPQDPMVRFKCSDSSDVPETWHDYRPFDVLTCIKPRGEARRTFVECMRIMARDAANKREDDLFRLGIGDVGQDDINCDWEILPHYDPPVEEWEPNDIGAKDIANEMIAAQAPPWWLKFLGIAVVGGVVVGLSGGPGGALLPVLCTLGGPDHWSCPSNPNYPPGQTPQPDK